MKIQNKKWVLVATAFAFILFSFLVTGCPSGNTARADREALFDYILAKTMEREAFSPIKNETLGIDIEQEMLKYRDEVINAGTDIELYYALVKLSNARRDRHLSVSPVEGGLELPKQETLEAPIRFLPDYGSETDFFVFVCDFTKDINKYTNGISPEVGDKLLTINGASFKEYCDQTEPFYRYSTKSGLWWKMAESTSRKSRLLPPHFYRDTVTFSLERKDGEKYTVEVPYLNDESLTWEGYRNPSYPGFKKTLETETFTLYLPEGELNVVLLQWHGFRADLIPAMDKLMEFAQKEGLLDRDVIVDATRSRGGSKGAYAIQRLSPKPFKTTFGNIRISDVVMPFIERKREQFANRRVMDGSATETVDDGSWLMDWLENDVVAAVEAGEEYTNNVPFKLAHLPKDSDGIVQPAEVHFTGKMVVFLGPQGGSHLDQFASIVADNDLALVLGMPAGGYSNTWEWYETLVFPGSQKPVVEFMWSMGHTIRPNGEILEGNPAMVDEYFPVTGENFSTYYETLMTRAMEYLN